MRSTRGEDTNMPAPSKITRRSLLTGATGLMASSLWLGRGVRAAGEPTLVQPRDTELVNLSAADAVRSMQAGEFTAERYAAALLARCESGASLNAFITLRPEQVLE